jgi:protein required for attachment to host cells
MTRTCIALVDATRARLFTFERTTDPGGDHDDFTEHADLVNPARRMRASDLFSDSRPGSNRTGPLQYAFDDHREAHLDNMDAEFARAVVGEIRRVMRVNAARRLVVCATPRMLGQLRAAELRHDGFAVDELPRDLVKLTAPELRDQLASYGLLPPKTARVA